MKTRIVETEPNLFRSDEKGFFTFQNDANGKVQSFVITGGISDPVTAERIAWYEDAGLHIGIVIAGILLVISRLLIIPIGFLARRFRKNKVEVESKFMLTGWRLSGAFAGLIVLSPMVLIAWLFTRETPVVYEMPWAITAVLTLWLIASLIGLALPFWSISAWRNRVWNTPKRLYFSILAIAGIVLPFFLYYWNLLGYRY